MPQTYVNVFSPQTPIGASLQNIAQAMFSGPSPYEQDRIAAQTDAYRGQASLYGAQAEKAAAEAAAARAAAERAGRLPEEVATAVFGDANRGRQFLNYRNTGNWGYEQPSPDIAGPPAPLAQPDWATPEAISRANTLTLAPTLATAAGRGNAPGAMDDIMGALFKDEIQRRALAGGLTPQQASDVGMATAGAAGRPLYGNMGSDGTFNQFTGANTLNDLGTAKVGTQRSMQAENYAQGRQADAGARENDAQAGAAAALARLRDRQDPNAPRGGGAGAVEIAVDNRPESPTFGQPIFVPRGQAVGMEPGARPRADVPPKALTPKQVEDSFINVLRGLGVPSGEVSPQVQGEIMERLNAGESPFAITTDIKGRLQKRGLFGSGLFGKYEATPRPGTPVPPVVRQQLAPPAAPVRPPAASTPQVQSTLPPQAAARLREGVVTKFANGQVWTLTNGQPVQVQ